MNNCETDLRSDLKEKKRSKKKKELYVFKSFIVGLLSTFSAVLVILRDSMTQTVHHCWKYVNVSRKQRTSDRVSCCDKTAEESVLGKTLDQGRGLFCPGKKLQIFIFR